MGICPSSKPEAPVSPAPVAPPLEHDENDEGKPSRRRRPSRTAIENNVDLSVAENLDDVMAQIMDDAEDLAEFQAFALDEASDAEVSLWTDVDDYCKQFRICDDDEGDTDEEKLTRKLEVERLLQAHFGVDGTASQLGIDETLVASLRRSYEAKTYRTTIWRPVRDSVLHDLAVRQLVPYIEFQKRRMRLTASSATLQSPSERRQSGSRIKRHSANARWDSDILDALNMGC